MADKVALINLGCPKNLVDAEVMLGHLSAEGYELTPDLEHADAVVVNTCGFLQDAAQESVDTLLQMAQRKKSGRLRAVIAAGCMTQRFGADVPAAMPEVDGFLGVGQSHALPGLLKRVLLGERVSILNGPSAGFEGYGLRLQASPGPTAYLKVSEGCDRKCAFCIIPQIRGGMVSRTIDTIVREAEVLAAQGTREIVLIGQDPTRYGADLERTHGRSPHHPMVELLSRLNDVRDLRWIRLMYLFPDRHVEPILEAVAALPRVCNYVDMPFQHVSAEVLRAMNRPGDAQAYLRLLEKLRSANPDISVRSTFIVGFPGETVRHVRELEDFLKRAQLDWMGLFKYSPEEGTPAERMDGQVPPRTSRARYHRLMALQQEITRERLRRWNGRDVEVVVESVKGDHGEGRTQGQAPDVDGSVKLDFSSLSSGRPGSPVRPGDFVQARVTGCEEYDLQAVAAEIKHRPPMRRPDLLQIGVM